MTFDWHSTVALTIVLVAAAYLVRSAWQVVARRKAARCGGCENCASTGAEDAQPVVQIGGRRTNGKATAQAAGVADRDDRGQ